MSTLEQEIIDKFRQLDKDAQRRVRALIEGEIESLAESFNYDAWLQDVEALRKEIHPSRGAERAATSRKQVNDREVQQIASYCRANLNLSSFSFEEYGYPNLVLCIIDAVFSIGVNYTSTKNTVNRFIAYVGNKPLSVSEFVELHQIHSVEYMAREVYKNMQRTSTRNGILKAEAVRSVADVLLKHHVENLNDMEAVINDAAFESAFRQIPGQRSGISLRYLYMLTGVDSEIKPDRMIIRFIEAALNRRVRVDECHSLLVKACESLSIEHPGLSPRVLDNAIWNFQRLQ